MKIYLLFVIISKFLISNQYQNIEKMAKCLNPDQRIKPNNVTSKTEFALTFWVRASLYHTQLGKSFLKIKNELKNKEIILKSSKDPSDYDINYYHNLSTHFLGSLPYSFNNNEEEDFITNQQTYNNWIFMGFSFYDLSKIRIYVNNSSKEFF